MIEEPEQSHPNFASSIIKSWRKLCLVDEPQRVLTTYGLQYLVSGRVNDIEKAERVNWIKTHCFPYKSSTNATAHFSSNDIELIRSQIESFGVETTIESIF